MAVRQLMQRFVRWHIWLGWLVGFPLLMWTVTGLFMALKPIDEVRGDDLRAKPPVVDTARLVFPNRIGEVRALRLVAQPDGPAWVVTEAGGGEYRYSATDGTLIPPVIKDEARRIADATYAGKSKLETVTYFPADVAPADLRTEVASWQAHYADGTNIYIHSSTGEVLAVRTGWWRAYDLMWGLHIMNLKDRENAHHPILIVFAGLSIAGAMLGCVLMFRRRKARVKA
jgi:uncharacterized iron-regulated membrane protein